MSGVFGKEIKEVLGMIQHLPADHVYLRNFLHEVAIDRNWNLADAESFNPEVLKSEVLKSPCLTRETVWVQVQFPTHK